MTESVLFNYLYVVEGQLNSCGVLWNIIWNFRQSFPGPFVHFAVREQWRIQDFPNGGALFCHKWGAHILFSGKKCMKLKEIGLKWGGARLLAPCYSKITIFL